MAASVTSAADALDLGGAEIAELDLGIDLEGGVEHDLAFRRDLPSR